MKIMGSGAVALSVLGAATAIYWFLPGPITRIADAVGVTIPSAYPDKLGWMDDEPFTEADQKRVAGLRDGGEGSDQSVISRIQAGSAGDVTRRDFELLRQDRRRARAAYPDVPQDELQTNAWIQVDLSAHVPMDWCSSGNANGTDGPDDKSYLDGGCAEWFVKPEYTKRADAATTKRVLAEMKQRARDKKAAHVRKWGYSMKEGGTGASLSINCNPDPLPSNAEDDAVAGKCVVVIDKDQFVFPFDPAEWADPPWSVEAIKKLASFTSAIASEYKPAPEKPWVREDGLLAKGEHCPAGRLCFSHWNGDGYDNEDIGPDTPVCWSMPGGWFAGLFYVTCNAKDDRRSVAGAEWTLDIESYGYGHQISPGWTEKECKDLMPTFLTGFSSGMMGQSDEELNRGNLKEARCYQDGSITPQGAILARREMPVKHEHEDSTPQCVQGGSLGPGQSCKFGG